MSASANIFISVPAEKNPQQKEAIELVKKYILAFNKRDMKSYFEIMDKDVIHDINQGTSEKGIEKFKTYMDKGIASFEENLSDVVIMVSDDGKYASARWTDHGKYFKDFPGFEIKSKNQKYVLYGGHFFEISNGKLSRVTTFYNVEEFMKQMK